MRVNVRKVPETDEREMQPREELAQAYAEKRARAHELYKSGVCEGSGHLPRCDECEASVYCREWRHLPFRVF